MGHRTWQSGQEPWGDEEIFPAPVFVLASKPREVFHQGGTTFTFVTDGPQSALDQAQAVAGDRDVTVMGSPNVAQQFLRAGLFDELRLTQVPVLLGGGVPLFGQLGAAAPVELERLSALESGEAVHQWFRVVR
jgi:dihydrofolate reductase